MLQLGTTTGPPPFHRMQLMPPRISNPQSPLQVTHIREWRQHRALSLDKLVDQMSERLEISKASLSRIERAQQPYTQPILEALAWALDCEPEHLLMCGPASELWSLWGGLQEVPTEKRRQTVNVLKALAEEKTDVA